jgi:hypothetical protein
VKTPIGYSYSCMPNMQNMMKQKNENLLKETHEGEQFLPIFCDFVLFK